jgi:hypothetical protein
VQGSQLLLRLPAGTLDGGEILSAKRVRYGTFEARVKAAAATGSVTAFFLYEGARSGNDEIDIELIGGTRATSRPTSGLEPLRCEELKGEIPPRHRSKVCSSTISRGWQACVASITDFRRTPGRFFQNEGIAHRFSCQTGPVTGGEIGGYPLRIPAIGAIDALDFAICPRPGNRLCE